MFRVTRLSASGVVLQLVYRSARDRGCLGVTRGGVASYILADLFNTWFKYMPLKTPAVVLDVYTTEMT